MVGEHHRRINARPYVLSSLNYLFQNKWAPLSSYLIHNAVEFKIRASYCLIQRVAGG